MLHTLAVDLGASSGRVMRASFTGDRLSVEQVHRFSNQPMYTQEGMFWNIHAIFDHIASGVARAGSIGTEIRAIGIDSWAVDFGLVDKNGRLVALPRHYRDSRNRIAMQAVLSMVTPSELYAQTGIQLQPFNTLFQLYAMQQHQSDLLNQASCLLLIPDLLNYLLTGLQGAEYTNATTTQLLNLTTMAWNEQLLYRFALPTQIMPIIKHPGTVLGTLSKPELIWHEGLRKTQVVHTASHDTASAVLSVPYSLRSYAYLSSGTWSLLGTIVDQPVITEQAREWNFTNEGGLDNFRLLKNVMGLWLIQEVQRSLRVQGQVADIESLVHAANYAPTFTHVFDPDDVRLLNPADMPKAIVEVCNDYDQTSIEDIASLIRSIFESLALKYRMVLEQLEQVTKTHFDVIYIVGGGSQNVLLNQFTANATGRVVVTGPVEASAMGNALVQLLALGYVHSQTEMTALLRRSISIQEFFPEDRDAWDAAYHVFQTRVKGV